jgi:hypothetical protein
MSDHPLTTTCLSSQRWEQQPGAQGKVIHDSWYWGDLGMGAYELARAVLMDIRKQ